MNTCKESPYEELNAIQVSEHFPLVIYMVHDYSLSM